ELVRSHVPELKAMEARGGGGSSQSGSVTWPLVPASERQRSTAEVVAALREKIAEIPGLNFRVSARSNIAQRLASGSFGSGFGDRISVYVQGHDLQLIRQVGSELQQLFSQVPGVA